jgi:hypothetical protein
MATHNPLPSTTPSMIPLAAPSGSMLPHSSGFGAVRSRLTVCTAVVMVRLPVGRERITEHRSQEMKRASRSTPETYADLSARVRCQPSGSPCHSLLAITISGAPTRLVTFGAYNLASCAPGRKVRRWPKIPLRTVFNYASTAPLCEQAAEETRDAKKQVDFCGFSQTLAALLRRTARERPLRQGQTAFERWLRRVLAQRRGGKFNARSRSLPRRGVSPRGGSAPSASRRYPQCI